MRVSDTEGRFLELLNRAYEGWKRKIELDFSATSSASELALLESDELYSTFGLATPEYVLIRLMGRVSISIGRRLGELYDNLPKYVAADRFGLTPAEVSRKVNGLNLDVCVPLDRLSADDVESVLACAGRHLKSNVAETAGLGIEIRYNFNPNDSARLRKDVAMAQGLRDEGLVPVYLVFSGISPRDEAIKRLKGGGWEFLIASQASDFTKDLLGLDLAILFENPEVRRIVEHGVDGMMRSLFSSAAFRDAWDAAARRPDPEVV